MKALTDSDRHTIVILIGNGLTTAEIRKYLKDQYTTQQIAAVRAWKTMREISTEALPKKTLDISDADKESIIKFLKKGLTNPKIQEKMSGRYSRQQIAAVHAWITMGKY